VKPFGAIATPSQGGEASGDSYINWGWALTPPPNMIPTDGSTVDVVVDGVIVGNAVYNNYREDVANRFPGYLNSDGAVGYYYLDTTAYENRVHTISWRVEDNAGNKDGIGSRFFSIVNTSGSQSQAQKFEAAAGRRYSSVDEEELRGAVPSMAPVYVKKGYDRRALPQEVYPDENGVIEIEIKEVERVVLSLNLDPSTLSFESVGAKSNRLPLSHKYESETSADRSGYSYTGYLKFQDELRPLPVGSTLDADRGIFYWQPGPGFLGEYYLSFINEKEGVVKNIKIVIKPKTFNNIVK